MQFTAWPEMLAWPYLILKGFLPYKDIAIAHNPLLIFVLTKFLLSIHCQSVYSLDNIIFVELASQTYTTDRPAISSFLILFQILTGNNIFTFRIYYLL